MLKAQVSEESQPQIKLRIPSHGINRTLARFKGRAFSSVVKSGFEFPDNFSRRVHQALSFKMRIQKCLFSFFLVAFPFSRLNFLTLLHCINTRFKKNNVLVPSSGGA